MVDLGNVTLWAAFAGGLLSFLSPCVLPVLPTFSAILAGSSIVKEGNRRKIYINAWCFLCGFTLVFIMMGATASFLGQWFFDHQPKLRQIGALLMIIMGLNLSGILHVKLLEQEYRPLLNRTFQGPLGAFLLGISFTLGWTPCTGPILTSILVSAGGTATVADGVLLLLAYAMGFSVPFLALAVIFRQYLDRVRRVYQWLPQLQRGAGYLLIIIGAFIWLDWLQKGLGLILQ